MVGMALSGKVLNRMKTTDFPMRKRRLLLPDCLQLGHQFFPVFGCELKHWLFLGVQPASIWTGMTPSDLLGLQLTGADAGIPQASIIM